MSKNVHPSRKVQRGDTPEPPKVPAAVPGGFCVWFTGLSGSGKTTTAEVLLGRLNALGSE